MEILPHEVTRLLQAWGDGEEQREGNHAEAASQLAAVCNWFTEGGNTEDLQEAHILLATI